MTQFDFVNNVGTNRTSVLYFSFCIKKVLIVFEECYQSYEISFTLKINGVYFKSFIIRNYFKSIDY